MSISKITKSELVYQNCLNDTLVMSPVKDLELLEEKEVYISPKMELFHLPNIVFNHSSGDSDSIAAFAQS